MIAIENKNYKEIFPIEYESNMFKIFQKLIKDPKAAYPNKEVNFKSNSIDYKLLIDWIDEITSIYTILQEIK